MRIAATYSFNDGRRIVEEKYPSLLGEITTVIENINEADCKTKVSRERTMCGRRLYSPTELNSAFKEGFDLVGGWSPRRVSSEYSVAERFYVPGYTPTSSSRRMNQGGFREMDFVKQRLGVEVQFGKYSFMVYNVCAKMTIFKNLDHIDVGVEIVPMRDFVTEMSSGVSYFEQFVWDLENRGVSNIDTPVLIIGITHGTTGSQFNAQVLPDDILSTSKELISEPFIPTGNAGNKPGPQTT